MPRAMAVCVLVIALEMGLSAQAPAFSPQESSSRAQPDAAPSPPDAPMPDVGAQTSAPPKSKAKKLANKFDPHCIDVIFHACWSSPAAPQQGKVLTEEEQKAKTASEDIDVGYYYLNEKNYAAAESRLKEAVEFKPDSGAALIGLAQAQQKLGKGAEARASYEAYLQLNPDGPDSEKVKKALAQLK